MSISINGQVGDGYIVTASKGSSTPVNSTTYYLALDNTLNTASGRTRLWIPVSGLIKNIYGFFTQTAGTNENSTLVLQRYIGAVGSPIYTVSSTLDHSSAITSFSATNINITVAAGDSLEFAWTTPAWIAAPTTVAFKASISIESGSMVNYNHAVARGGYIIVSYKPGGGTPADATPYYLTTSETALLVTVSGSERLYVRKTGILHHIYGNFQQTAGTNEGSTLTLRQNGADVYTISSTLDHSSAVTSFSATNIDIAVTAGDWLEFGWTTPTWVTNPTAVRFCATIYVE